jgi:DNA-binding LacI/PurR family transcriptional regulator
VLCRSSRAPAAAALRYKRNDLAASLRHGARSFTLGLVIEDVANPFYSAIAQAVEERARARSSMLITASAREDPVRKRELVTALLRRRVDALLVVPTGADHRYIHDAGFDTRTVFLDRPPARAKADTVLVENAAGARRAVASARERSHAHRVRRRRRAPVHRAGAAGGLPEGAGRRPGWTRIRRSSRSATAPPPTPGRPPRG